MKRTMPYLLMLLAAIGIGSCEIIPEELTDVRVNDIAHIGDDTILVATSYGLFQSTNSGTSWSLITSSLGTVDVNKIDVGGDGSLAIATANGFYHSRNLGQNWDGFLTGKTEQQFSVISVGAAPAQPQSYLYSGQGNALAMANAVTAQQQMNLVSQSTTISGVSLILSLSTNASSGYSQVAMGTNNGVYTAPLGTTNFTQATLKTGEVMTTSVSKVIYDAAGNLYAGTAEGLYKSEDLGTLWDLNSSVTNIQDLDVNEAGMIVVKSASILLKSVDAGSSWTNIPAGLGSTVNKVIALPNGGILTGTETGIFKLDGSSWSNLNLQDFIEL